VISVIVLFRNAPHHAEQCLRSLRACHQSLATLGGGGVEYLLFDDCSDADRAVLPMLAKFRNDIAPQQTSVVRFKRQMHYAAGLAHGMSMARGEHVLFVSHDMQLTPDCVGAMMDVARDDDRVGIVRPTSQHMDWAKSFVTKPPTPLADLNAIIAFSAEVRRQFGAEAVDWPMLIGDAMLITRPVIDRIGVFDTRFFGFMSDIDYGIRLHRAGFRHVIARGAWLDHAGAGTAKEMSADDRAKFEQQGREMVKLVETAYGQFRAKWGEANLPPTFREMRREHFDRLNTPPPHPSDYIPPLQLSASDAEIL
jgi:GT2 family glycosyltransferase